MNKKNDIPTLSLTTPSILALGKELGLMQSIIKMANVLADPIANRLGEALQSDILEDFTLEGLSKDDRNG